MGKRVRERDKEKRLAPSKRKAKSKLVDGPVTTDWNKTLTQFTAAYLNQINLNLTQNTGQAREGLTDYLVDIISDLETVDWGIPDSLPNVCMRSRPYGWKSLDSGLADHGGGASVAQVLQTDLKQTVDASS